MGAHTPLPWQVYGPDGVKWPGIEAASATIVVFGYDDDDEAGVRGTEPGEPEAKANAEFIVRACNSHYDLLEALEDAAQTFRRYEDMHAAKGSIEGDMKARANAAKAEKFEAIIARAKGGAK
jgi:hypothetical protein